MKLWIGRGLGVFLLGTLPVYVHAQAAVGGAAVAAAPAVGAAAPAAAAPAAAGGGNLWSFLCPTPAQKAACKEKICNSTAGQLLNNSLKPASALTGGVIPLCCPPPGLDPANVNKFPPDSALGAAARIQADEAGAKARRAAVRYLGTVDCNYWPEAQAALINALRADRNECVRLEAALALSRGCCCKKNVIAALVLTVSGSRADDNPAESCERVKLAAAIALDHCLSCYTEVVPAPPPPPPAEEKLKTLPKPEIKPKGEKELIPVPPPPDTIPAVSKTPATQAQGGSAEVQTAGYYDRALKMDEQLLVRQAREVLARGRVVTGPAPVAAGGASPKEGIVGIISTAFSHERNDQTVAPPVVQTTPAVQTSTQVVPVSAPSARMTPAAAPFVAPVPVTVQPVATPVQPSIFSVIRDKMSRANPPVPAGYRPNQLSARDERATPKDGVFRLQDSKVETGEKASYQQQTAARTDYPVIRLPAATARPALARTQYTTAVAPAVTTANATPGPELQQVRWAWVSVAPESAPASTPTPAKPTSGSH